MKRPPLLIISCSRSGSSMLAGIFYLHGFWVGTRRPPDKFNEKGYFENLAVKKCMKGHFKDNIHEANKGKVYDIAPEKVGLFKNMIEGVVKRDGYKDNGWPWVVKFGACYWKPWKRVYPSCTTICLYRDSNAIKESGKRSFRVSDERIASHKEVMDNALRDCPDSTFRVDYEELVSGNLVQLFPPFKREGVEFDPVETDLFIEPALDHFGKGKK